MNPNSHCKASIFEEEFRFQYIRGDIHIHSYCHTNIILTFLSEWNFACSVNMEVFPNIWNRNTFQTTSLCALRVYYMVFQMFSILLQTARVILNSLICVAYFSNNSNSVFHKKGS